MNVATKFLWPQIGSNLKQPWSRRYSRRWSKLIDPQCHEQFKDHYPQRVKNSNPGMTDPRRIP